MCGSSRKSASGEHHTLKAESRPLPWPDGDRCQGDAVRLVRGTFTHQYPYGFVNVWRIGYAQVAINIVAILIGALLFMALFALADWLTRRVSRR